MTQDTATTPEVPETGDQSERGALLRKAYGAATTRLREENRSQFDKFYMEEAAALGVDYTPKPTPEQKAEQELAALLEQYPHLRSKVAQA